MHFWLGVAPPVHPHLHTGLRRRIHDRVELSSAAIEHAYGRAGHQSKHADKVLRLVVRQIDDIPSPLSLRRIKSCMHAAII